MYNSGSNGCKLSIRHPRQQCHQSDADAGKTRISAWQALVHEASPDINCMSEAASWGVGSGVSIPVPGNIPVAPSGAVGGECWQCRRDRLGCCTAQRQMPERGQGAHAWGRTSLRRGGHRPPPHARRRPSPSTMAPKLLRLQAMRCDREIGCASHVFPRQHIPKSPIRLKDMHREPPRACTKAQPHDRTRGRARPPPTGFTGCQTPLLCM